MNVSGARSNKRMELTAPLGGRPGTEQEEAAASAIRRAAAPQLKRGVSRALLNDA